MPLKKAGRRAGKSRAPAIGGEVPTITCVNRSTIDFGIDFDRLIRVLQTYVDKHLAPVWGTPAKLVKGTKPAAGTWTMMFFDHAGHAKGLGFHKASYQGSPIARIFVQSALENGEPVSLVSSHELAEMLVDPGDNLWAARRRGVLYAYEVCDAVEETMFAIDRVPVSNFVYPAYYHPHAKPNSTAFDHLGVLTRPFQILPGGYLQVLSGSSVRKMFTSPAKKRRFAKEDRRLHRSEGREIHRKRTRRT